MISALNRTKAVLRAPLRLLRLPYTVLEEMRLKEVGSELPDARLAFIEDMTGRAKATLGFVLGNERLLAAGQMERARAAERLRAAAEQATAQEIEQRAEEQFEERTRRARRQKTQASAEHTAQVSQIARDTAQERKRAEADAARARNSVKRREAETRQVIDATDEAVRRDTAGRLIAAEIEEGAAEDAREVTDEIEAARRGDR